MRVFATAQADTKPGIAKVGAMLSVGGSVCSQQAAPGHRRAPQCVRPSALLCECNSNSHQESSRQGCSGAGHCPLYLHNTPQLVL